MNDEKNEDVTSTRLLDAAVEELVDSVKNSEEKIELIFQCLLPPRRFSVSRGIGQRKVLGKFSSKADPAKRKVAFEIFVKEIKNVVGTGVNAFETSGSVAANVTVSELREIIKSVGNLKEVRSNRRFKVES